MTDKRTFWLAHDAARESVAAFAKTCAEGWKVVFSPPARTLDQNALMWPLLECFSKQLLWPVNGRLVTLEPEEWKDVLTAAFHQEAVRLAMGLNGGVVMLGKRTSKFPKATFSEFIEFIMATAAERGVVLDRKAEAVPA